MSELLPIWNNTQLTGAITPPPFNIPNSHGCSIKINNQSGLWLKIVKTATGGVIDRMEPFSYLILPNQKDITLEVDTAHPVSTLNADTQLVDYSTLDGAVTYQKGSTTFSGSSNVTIQGDVEISNSAFDVTIQGTPTFNLSPGQTVSIANSSLAVQIQGTPSFTVANSTLDVSGSYINATIQGTPVFELAAGASVDVTGSVVTANIAANQSITISNSSLAVNIQGTPTFQLAAGTSVNISNSSLAVNIQGTPTFAVAAGSKMDVSGSTITASIAAGASIAISNSSLAVNIQGTPTFNLAAGSEVSITNSSLNVAITGTPTFTLAAGAAVSITNSSLNVSIQGTPQFTVANSSLNVQIQGTPTFNLAAGTSVSVSNSYLNVNIQGTPSFTVANSQLNVSVQGTPTFQLAAGTSVNIASGTIEVSSANATIVNEQLPTTQIYTGYKAFTMVTGATTMTVELTYLPNGNMVELHRGTFFVKSAQGLNYTVSSIIGKATFGDGTTFNAPSNFEVSGAGPGVWMFGGQPCISNMFEVVLTLGTAPTSNDTVTIYYQVDANDTAIDVQPGFGVPTVGVAGTTLDASGTIAAASTSQQALAVDPTARRKYLLIQNNSTVDLYVNLGAAASNGPGSLRIPPNGGGLTWENNYIPADSVNVWSTQAGASYTVKYN